jgi:Phosphodiester glycosidase
MVVQDHARNLACLGVRRGMAAVATLVALGVVPPTTAVAGTPPSLVENVSETVQVDPGVEWTRIERGVGPMRINVLAVDPARVRGVLSNERIAGRERVSRMARRVGAVAGVNGSYFTPSGDPVGALAISGELLSEPVDGRSALILPAAVPPFIAPVRFRGRLTVNGRSREIDGIDRTRGLIPACGGRGGDVPTTRPNAVLTCTDSSELVVLTPRYGARPPREGGVEAIVRDGRVASVRPPGTGPVPRDGVLLTGTGDAARFLRDAALPRSPAEISLALRAGRRPLDINQASVVLGHGPRLLRAGRLAIPAAAEGFAPPQAPSFSRSFVAGRNARTLAGMRADGTLLLATVDGRRPGWSAGMTLREAAHLMRSLGAREALNLGGGGSSTMTIRGEVVNRPSDRVGERPVSDGLFVMP